MNINLLEFIINNCVKVTFRNGNPLELIIRSCVNQIADQSVQTNDCKTNEICQTTFITRNEDENIYTMTIESKGVKLILYRKYCQYLA